MSPIVELVLAQVLLAVGNVIQEESAMNLNEREIAEEKTTAGLDILREIMVLLF